jgi:hypothetical protein
VNALRRLLASEPTLIASAVRLTILAAVGFGLDWTTEQVVGLMAAVEAWMAVYARAAVIPVQRAQQRIEEAADLGREAGRAGAEADLRSLAPVKKAAPRKAAR